MKKQPATACRRLFFVEIVKSADDDRFDAVEALAAQQGLRRGKVRLCADSMKFSTRFDAYALQFSGIAHPIAFGISMECCIGECRKN